MGGKKKKVKKKKTKKEDGDKEMPEEDDFVFSPIVKEKIAEESEESLGDPMQNPNKYNDYLNMSSINIMSRLHPKRKTNRTIIDGYNSAYNSPTRSRATKGKTVFNTVMDGQLLQAKSKLDNFSQAESFF